MARHFAPRHFLRIVSNVLLGEYFHARGLLTDVPFDGEESEIDAIYDAWQALPTENRVSIDIDFTRIDAMASEEAIAIFIREGRHLNVDLNLTDGGHHDKAFAVFLKHPELFARAYQLVNVEDRPEKYWIRRNDLPDFSLSYDEAMLARLASALSYYFRESEGRGHVCIVEPCVSENVTFFFCYLEDHGRAEVGFGDDNRLKRVAMRPAFEVVFALSEQRHSLDIFYDGPKKTVKPLTTIFCRLMLGFELPESRTGPVYELNALKSRDFRFTYGPSLGITNVVIKHLMFSAIGGLNRQLLVRADTTRSHRAVHDFMDEFFDTGRANNQGKLPVAAFNITQARIQVLFQPVLRRRPPSRTFNISFPNGCSLGHDGKDEAIREMLRLSGIELEPQISPQRELVGSAAP